MILKLNSLFINFSIIYNYIFTYTVIGNWSKFCTVYTKM